MIPAQCRKGLLATSRRVSAASNHYSATTATAAGVVTSRRLAQATGARSINCEIPSVRSFSTASHPSESLLAEDSVGAPTQAPPPPLHQQQQPPIEINVAALVQDLERAAAWNHGQTGKGYDATLWNPEYCRTVTDRYNVALQSLSMSATATAESTTTSTDATANQQVVVLLNNGNNGSNLLLAADTVTAAFKALLKCQYDPDELSSQVRDWERCIGLLKQTTLTDALSLRLLEANGKAGNVGRVLSLLHLRKARNYKALPREFVYAITSLQAAHWKAARQRNIFVGDREQPAVDNPTRWLDAILLNMHQRDFQVTTQLANRMLNTYAAGKSGKAVHHFYRVVRHATETLPVEEQPAETAGMPAAWAHGTDSFKYQPVSVRLKYNVASPPFYKVPAQVKGKMLFSADDLKNGQFKLEREQDPEWSLPLTAAFSFCESLQHGACGHAPVHLNVSSYNALIKACVYRGAMWRALQLVDTVMPDNSVPANIVTFNHILGGLARVGDVVTAQEYYRKLLNAGLQPNAYTVRAIVDGLLNLGDLAGAVTVVQDFFNQHTTLPPYTTHIKILEFCLARDMIYESKRYVFFLQQLEKWEPNEYHSEEFCKLMLATQKNTQLQKPALQQLFAYFGETLTEEDFL